MELADKMSFPGYNYYIIIIIVSGSHRRFKYIYLVYISFLIEKNALNNFSYELLLKQMTLHISNETRIAREAKGPNKASSCERLNLKLVLMLRENQDAKSL